MSRIAKPSTPLNFTARDSRTGRFVTVKGAGALKGSGFAVRREIDLTKPIAGQASNGKSAQKQSTVD